MEEKDMIKKPIGIRIFRGIMIGFGLLLLNLIFVLGPYLGVWGIVIGAVASGFAFVLAGMALIAAYFIALPFTITVPLILSQHPALLIMAGGIFAGSGGILLSLFLWLGKYLIIGTGKYFMWHVNLIRGDEYE